MPQTIEGSSAVVGAPAPSASAAVPAKQAYRCPELHRLGSVRHLTLGRTGRGGDFASLRG
jgi:hypothetical protein